MDVVIGFESRQSAIARMFNSKIWCRLISALSAVEPMCGSAVFLLRNVGVWMDVPHFELVCVQYSAL